MGRDKIGNIKTQDRDTNDFYATNPYDVKEIINILNLKTNLKILEPCAGNGHISQTLKDLGFNVYSNDMIQREYNLDSNVDFLKTGLTLKFDVVITNPPFKYAKEFIEKSLQYADTVIILAKLDLFESEKRMFINNRYLENVYVHTKRAKFAKGGNNEYFKKSSSMSTAWFIYNKNKPKNTKIQVEII